MIPVHSTALPLLVEQSNDTFNYKMTKALSQFARTGWTPERKVRQAAAIQRWRPWDRSTGPRTLEGKTKSAVNGNWSRPLARILKLPPREFLRFIK